MNVNKDSAGSSNPDNSKLPLLIIIIFLVIVSGFLLLAYFNPKKPEPEDTAPGLVDITEIEESRPADVVQDNHGCLIDAGFLWCEIKEKCIKKGEEECPEVEVEPSEVLSAEQTEIVNKAKTHIENMEEYKVLGGGPELKFVEILQMRCIGCWEVIFSFEFDTKNYEARVTFENDEVSDGTIKEIEVKSDEKVDESKSTES